MTPFSQQELDAITLPEHARHFLDVQGLDAKEAEYIDLSNRVSKIQATIRQPYRPNPPKPPNIAPHWEALGEFMQMDPHEIKIILEHVMENPNETVRPALRQLLILGKLQSTEGVAQHRQEMVARRQKYEENLRVYEDAVQQAEPATRKLEQLRLERHAVYWDLWNGIVDQLQVCCEVANNRMNRLSPGAFSALTILERNSRYVVYDRSTPGDPLIVVQWDFLYKFKAPHVDTILGFFKRVGLLNGRPRHNQPGATGNASQSVDDHTPGQPQDPQQQEQPDDPAQLPDTLGHGV